MWRGLNQVGRSGAQDASTRDTDESVAENHIAGSHHFKWNGQVVGFLRSMKKLLLGLGG